jgi:hypothetical protein
LISDWLTLYFYTSSAHTCLVSPMGLSRFFWDRVFPRSPGWPWPSASPVLWLQACTTKSIRPKRFLMQ